jgi:hypothetical protein
VTQVEVFHGDRQMANANQVFLEGLAFVAKVSLRRADKDLVNLVIIQGSLFRCKSLCYAGGERRATLGCLSVELPL